MKTLNRNRFLISAFVLVLLIPAGISALQIKESKQSKENKQLASAPTFDIGHLDGFPEKFDNFFNDRFPFRNTLISIYNHIQIDFWKISPKPKLVSIGKDNWLFLMNNEVNNFTGKMWFSDNMITSSIDELNWRFDTCKAMGAEYMVVIIPSKPTIYEEYLPSYVIKAKNGTVTDKFLKGVNGKVKCKILDLREPILKTKSEGQLYYRSDNHWNDLATYKAYSLIMDFVNKNGYKVPVFPISNCRQFDSSFASGNIANMIDMQADFKEPMHYVVPQIGQTISWRPKENYPCPEKFPYCFTYEEARQNKDSTLPGLLVFRESFTNDKLINLMATSFGRSTFIFDSWKHKLDLEILQKEKPKLVICMVLEGFIDCFAVNRSKPKTTQTKLPIRE